MIKYEFETRLDDGVVTTPMKVEAWGKKQSGWLRFIVLTFLVPWLKKRRVEVKTHKTMKDVDQQAKALVEAWEKEEAQDKSHITYTVIENPLAPLGLKELRITDERFERD